MKLALSNLAWAAEDMADAAALAEAGVDGVEIALTRIAPWEEQTDALIKAHRDSLRSLGLATPSLQAVLFGVEGVALLADEPAFERMAHHLARVAARGALLGAEVAVFGSPRQRSRGALAESEAFDLGVERFARLAAVMDREGMTLGLEPVPAHYGGDFLPTAEDVLAMVRAVDHPGLRLHLDTGCVMLGGGEIGAAVRAGADVLAHFHIAEPDLAGFEAPRAPHAEAASALSDIRYSRWLCIEMREDSADPIAAALKAVTFARSAYVGV